MKSIKSRSVHTVRHTPAKQSGFSLIELMIASVIGLVLLSGVATIFSSNSASSKMSSGTTRLQDSGRVALDILSYSIRMTGYEGCRDEVKGQIEVFAIPTPTVNFPNNAIWGSEVNGSGSWNPTAHNDLNGTGTAEDITSNVKADTDVLYVQYGSGRSVNLLNDMSGTNEDIVLPKNPDQIVAGDLLMISDCETANIFRATGVSVNSGTTTIQHAAGSSNTQGNLSRAFQGTGNMNAVPVRIMRFESKAYYVGNSGRSTPKKDPVFSLFELDTTTPNAKPVELIEGVEDFQILYGVQSDPSAQSDIRYVTADNVTNPGHIVSVQLGILISTADYSAPSVDDQTYNIAGWTVGPPGAGTDANHSGDKRLRASFNATIQLRNRLQ